MYVMQDHGGMWRAVCDCGCGCEAVGPTYNRMLGAWRKVCREYEERAKLISQACEAEEQVDIDELERFAKEANDPG